MKKNVFLGIDTSNYRTSICVIDEEENIIFEAKELIPVDLGDRGLMQSEAVFHHIKRLPQLLAPFPQGEYQWLAVASSTKPRPQKNSYMPVFLVGESIARFMATMVQAAFYKTTHQEGHIAAGLYSLGHPIKASRFFAIHLSGGTTELLLVESSHSGYDIQCLGQSMDLHAGQLIDRIGVTMGLSFPAGPQLEQLAQKAAGIFSLPSSVKGYNISFSGPETAAMRAIQQGIAREEVAFAVQKTIAKSIEKVVRQAVVDTGIKDVLIVGGVASNQYIKTRLRERLEHPAVQARLFFTTPEFSSDNAYGVACLAKQRFKSEH